jgi:hypothetical protein
VTSGSITAAGLLGRVLRAAGVDALYGRPLPGLDVVPVDAGRLAELMADAHRRVHGRPAAVHLGDGRVVVGEGGAGGEGRAGAGNEGPADPDRGERVTGGGRSATVSATTVSAATADDLLGAVGAVHRAVASGDRLTLTVAVDPGQPVPDRAPPPPPPVDRWMEPADELVARLAAAERPVVLAGPGVVRAGAVPGLHAVAASANLGVLNTWGAKGVFDWRSRHHLATAGLQAHDFELAGFGDADLILAIGVEPTEAGGERWRLAPAVEASPGALDALAGRWSRPLADIPIPPLRAELARITQEGWAAAAAPLPPSLVTRHYGMVLGAGGLVAADPGIPGYWVARTFATTELGVVQVPADPAADGFAVACALVARLRTPHRPVLAVVPSPLTDATRAALDAAARLGVAVPVEAWDVGGEALDPDAHHARLAQLVHADAPDPDAPLVAGLATDPRQLERMVGVAGEVVAWTG